MEGAQTKNFSKVLEINDELRTLIDIARKSRDNDELGQTEVSLHFNIFAEIQN